MHTYIHTGAISAQITVLAWAQTTVLAWASAPGVFRQPLGLRWRHGRSEAPGCDEAEDGSEGEVEEHSPACEAQGVGAAGLGGVQGGGNGAAGLGAAGLGGGEQAASGSSQLGRHGGKDAVTSAGPHPRVRVAEQGRQGDQRCCTNYMCVTMYAYVYEGSIPWIYLHHVHDPTKTMTRGQFF